MCSISNAEHEVFIETLVTLPRDISFEMIDMNIVKKLFAHRIANPRQ